jgi:hypothetical protein
MSDAIIDQAIEEIKTSGETTVGKPGAPEQPKVDINGESVTLDQAEKIIQALKAAFVGIERFDHTKPRMIEPVPINIGGKTRHLTMPFWALKKFQQEAGVSPWDYDKVWSIPADLDLTVTLLWVALLDENPDLTLEEVWRFQDLNFGNIHYLRHCLDECWGRNNPEAEAGKPSNGSGDPNSPGKRRGG